MKIVKTFLAGLGTVNQGFLKILLEKESEIKKYGINFMVTGIADSSGTATNDMGFDPSELLQLKSKNGKIKDLPNFDSGLTITSALQYSNQHLLIESTPGNLETGNPGLSITKSALKNGCSVVLANKAPLIFDYDGLHQLANDNNTKLRFSATVCGGLPVINVLTRDLKTASLRSLRGIFNATSNYVLKSMEEGGTLNDAIAEAQRLGAAEADPSHDLNGHDSANKLFIIMKSFTGYDGNINDIHVTGIEGIDAETSKKARSNNKTIKLVASAILAGGRWDLSIKPEELDTDSFLSLCNGWEMGLEIETDLYEKICMKNYEADPLGTSAAVLRDAIDIFAG